jgi:hypothetical protein
MVCEIDVLRAGDGGREIREAEALVAGEKLLFMLGAEGAEVEFRRRRLALEDDSAENEPRQKTLMEFRAGTPGVEFRLACLDWCIGHPPLPCSAFGEGE